MISKQYISYCSEVKPLINEVQDIKNDQLLFNQLPEKSQSAILAFLEQFANNYRQ